MGTPEHYLGITDVAERLGVTKPALYGLHLPQPDVYVGRTRGWRESTIDEWNASRPGHGGRPRRKEKD